MLIDGCNEKIIPSFDGVFCLPSPLRAPTITHCAFLIELYMPKPDNPKSRRAGRLDIMGFEVRLDSDRVECARGDRVKWDSRDSCCIDAEARISLFTKRGKSATALSIVDIITINNRDANPLQLVAEARSRCASLRRLVLMLQKVINPPRPSPVHC